MGLAHYSVSVAWLGRNGGGRIWEGALAGSALLAAGALAALALRPEEGPRRWALAAAALALLAFGLVQAGLPIGRWLAGPGAVPAAAPPLLGVLATLALLGAVLAMLWRGPSRPPGPMAWPAAGGFRRRDQAGDAEPDPASQGKKLESLGILASGLAHDFNNLLGAMAGNVELAKLEMNRGANIDSYFSTLEALVNRSSNLVGQILAYSGRTRPEITALDLNQQVEEMTRLLRASLHRKPTLRLEAAPDLPPMRGDLAQIQQVIMNLILNASEAVGPEGGIITLRTGRESLSAADIDADYRGQHLAPGLHVFLEVADNGPAMPPEVAERLFDPEFADRFAGRGIGLSAVRRIIEDHHGGLRVRREGVRGTCFKLLFPAALEVPAPVAAAPAEGDEAFTNYRGWGTILVVDDEAPLRAIASKALQLVGFDTLEAQDGLEALQVFEANQDRIRLVLLDLAMPRMDGEEAYRVLRRSGILVPVIISTGFAEADVVENLSCKGLAGFLQKPYRLQDLITQVRETLAASAEPGADPRTRAPVSLGDDLRTDIPVLDLQHRKLVETFNELLERVRAGAPEADQAQAFRKMQEAALAHFAAEDALMARCAYGRRKQHRTCHANLIGQLAQVTERIRSQQPAFTPAVLDFLEGWLIHHMQEEDRLLGKFLRGQGH